MWCRWMSKLLGLFVIVVLCGGLALPANALQTSGQTATVTTRALNVRDVPNLSGNILTVIHLGEVYPIVGQSTAGTWWQIVVGGTTGWVSGRHVSVLSGVPTGGASACSYAFFFNNPTSDVCPDAPSVVQAAFQRYNGGFMLWFGDSGSVIVFFSDGHYAIFPQSSYAGYPDAAPETPPVGLVMPVNGFGRVWAHLSDYSGVPIRTQLGWANVPESGYQATRQVAGRTSHVHTYVSLPDGRILDIYSELAGARWSMLG